MPYEIPRPRIRRSLCAALAAVLLALIVPAAANACTVSTADTSQPFATLGDDAYYTLVKGSDFDAGTDGWSLARATLTSKVLALAFDGTTSSNALLISPGGSAISPPICVSDAIPTFRFFSLGSAGFNQLNVQLLWKDAAGYSHLTAVGWVHGNGSWRASPALMLGSALPLWMHGSTLQVRLQFQTVGFGAWAIDRIYVDPYTRGG